MKDNKYQFAAIGLMGVLAMMIIPANFGVAEENDKAHFYGGATLVYQDAQGNEKFRQSIHNVLVDTGENWLLGQAFDEDGTFADEVTEANQMGAICIDASVLGVDADDAADFASPNNVLDDTVNDTCIVDTQVDITSNGIAVVGPLTFQEGTHITNPQTIDGIGICQGNGGTTPYQDCVIAGILFASVNTSNVTPGVGESVQITYTFDISGAT